MVFWFLFKKRILVYILNTELYSEESFNKRRLTLTIRFRGKVMQIEKALINDRLHVSKMFSKISHSNYL